MSAPGGLFTFPGIFGVQSGTLTWKHGTTPSIATLAAPLQSGPYPKIGTLVISYGGIAIQLPDCYLIDLEMVATESGQQIQYHIADRRWRWQDGDIRGRYNYREGEEVQRKLRNEKTPQELANLCWAAMREAGAVVSALPNDARPECVWEGLPAEMLTRLCESRGCRPTLDPITNKATIVVVGVGPPLPNGDIKADSLTVDPPELPDEFIFQFGDTIWEMDIELEPVAEELNGSDKGKFLPLEDVSWKPPGGFEKDHPPDWPNVALKYREHAKDQVFRYWRPKLPIKQWGHKIEHRELILPLHDRMVQSVNIDKTLTEKPPAKLFAKFYQGEPDLKPVPYFLQTKFGVMAEFTRGFTIDRERGIIHTSEPLFRITNAQGVDVDINNPGDLSQTQIRGGQLILRTGVSVRDKETGAFIRHEIKRKPGSRPLGTPPHYVRRDDIAAKYWHSTIGSTVTDKNNLTQIERHGNAYLDEEIARYEILTPGSRVYAGLVLIGASGAIPEITWSVSKESGTTTTISRNRERAKESLTYDELREISLLRRLATKFKSNPKAS